jgi:hypothetical protein
VTLRSLPRRGAAPDPSSLISTHHIGDEVDATVAITLYGLVLDCRCCGQPTTALLAFVPNGDPGWDRRRAVLCNTEASLAVADTALPEIVRIVNAVGRPAYDGRQPAALTNACFHCDTPITGDDLAEEVRRDELDGLVDLGRADVPGPWLRAALDGAGRFLNHSYIPGPSVVPKILRVMLHSRRPHDDHNPRTVRPS